MKQSIRFSKVKVSNVWRKATLDNLESKLLSEVLELRESLRNRFEIAWQEERGDVPGWVLVVLMTTGLVTAIWAIAAPRLSSILRNSLDSMNNVR